MEEETTKFDLEEQEKIEEKDENLEDLDELKAIISQEVKPVDLTCFEIQRETTMMIEQQVPIVEDNLELEEDEEDICDRNQQLTIETSKY